MYRERVSTVSFILCLVLNAFSQTGPGGVGDNTSNIFWLDANEIPTGTYSDGDNLDTWLDVSGNGLDFTQPTPILTPEFKAGVLNGYPVVRFNKTNGRIRRTGIASFPTTAVTTFVVNQNTGETNDALISYASTASNNNYLLFNSASLNIYRNGSVGSGVTSNDGNWHIIDHNWRSSDGDNRIWLDGTQNYSGTFQTGSSITANGCFALAGEQDAIDGSYDAAQAHFGDYAEVLMYNISLNQAQRIIVANYLAAKYNIAMAGNDYFAYEATHSIDVAGIGREIGATQTHTAAMSDNILQVENPSGLVNQEYLIFGHDDADVTAAWTATEVPAGGTVQRLAREWRFSETNGDVGTIDFLVDVATLPALPVGYTKYAIMVDSDGDFTLGADVYEIGLVAGTEYDLTGINIVDGDFVAIAVIDPEVQFTLDKSNGFEPVNALLGIELNYIPRTNVTVDYTTADGTALVAQPDYTAAAGLTATILAGSSAGTINITIIDDVFVEPDETLTITLSNPVSGVTLGAELVHNYTINDDDDLRKIYYNLASSSASEAVTAVTVNVSMSSTSATNVTVDYAVTGGTATGGAGNDYILASGNVTIIGGSGLTTGSFTFSVNDDAVYEYDETILIKLSNPSGCNLDNPVTPVGTGFIDHTYTIFDNDTPPVIQFTTSSSSGDESVSPVAIGIEINTSTETVTMATYTVADVTATSPSDYVLASGAVSIGVGATTASLIASIIDDGLEELPEIFTVTLSAPTDATIGVNNVFTYTILDNDQFGYLGPGGVGKASNNKLWVSADDGIYNDAGTTLATAGQSAQEWHDRSGNNHDLSQPNATFKPNYVENIINSKPVMRFNVSNNRIRRLAFNDFPTTNITTFSVGSTSQGNDAHVSYATAADNNNYLLFNSTNQTTFIAGSSAGSGQSFGDGNWHILGHTWRSNDGQNIIYRDGSQVYTGTISSGLSITAGGCLALAGEQDNVDGGYSISQDYQGDIAETIIYNVKLNDAQRIIVSNYLSAKYGIAITNDFYVHQALFGHEVAGIGREDASNFQLDGQGSGMVRINTPTSLDDSDYMIWGHDNMGPGSGPYTAPWVGELPASVNNALHRVWKVDKTNDVGNVDVLFDVTNLTIGNSADLVLLIDSDDGDFANATVLPLTSFDGAYAHFDGVNFGDGNWFTLGSLTNINPLPIELLSFKAQPNEGVVETNWQTASEINNDFFSVQRSVDGVEWQTINVVDGAGNSNAQLSYRTIDTDPVEGVSYYKLKQTDFDGNYTYSSIETVNFSNEFDHVVNVYPNPTSNVVTIEGQDKEVKNVKVYNAIGQDVTRQVTLTIQTGTRTVVDLSSLATGLYLVKTKTVVSRVYKK